MLNHSFEDTISCPDAIGQVNKCWYWDNPTNNSPDYFHSCHEYGSPWFSNADVPENFWGYQNALSGVAYCGFGIEEDFNNKEYLSGRLNSPLDSLKKYLVSFYVSATGNLAIDRLGIYFSEIQIQQAIIGNLNFTPQIESPRYYTFGDTLNWVIIEDTLFAQGGEEFLVIGNFHDVSENQYDTIAFNPFGGYIAYYYIDDVSVIEILDTTDTVQPIDSTIFEINLFPNPNNGEFVLNYNLSKFNDGVFKIYNAIGQIVYEEKLMQNNGIRNLLLQLASGAYVWEVKSSDAVLKRERMIVTK